MYTFYVIYSIQSLVFILWDIPYTKPHQYFTGYTVDKIMCISYCTYWIQNHVYILWTIQFNKGLCMNPDNKVPEANMGPTWVRWAPHVGLMNLAIWEDLCRIPVTQAKAGLSGTCSLRPGAPDKTNGSLGNKPQYSTQTLIWFAAYIFQFHQVLCGWGGNPAIEEWACCLPQLLLWSEWGSRKRQSNLPASLAGRSSIEVQLERSHRKNCHGTGKTER